MSDSFGNPPLGKKLQWQQSQQHPVLNPQEVHLWWLPLTLNDQQTIQAKQLLSDIQRDKYHRRHATQKQAYLAGRYYLFHLLAAYSGRDANEVELNYNPFNKPSLNYNPDNIQFNFSDVSLFTTELYARAEGLSSQSEGLSSQSESHGLFAFARDRQVGIDIERLNRNNNFEMLLEKRFTEQEQAFVRPEQQINLQRCVAIWTRKEAYGKAIGRGINFKMNAINLAPNENNEFAFQDQQQSWQLQQLYLNMELIGCLVYGGYESCEIKAFNCKNHLP